jgi:hypothetical protein
VGQATLAHDMAHYKLTDEEVVKLPPFDQFTEHTEQCEDDNGLPEMLVVEFPVTKVGTHLFLGVCESVTLLNLGSEEYVRASLMGQHPRLRGNSPLRELDMELCVKNVQLTFSTY